MLTLNIDLTSFEDTQRSFIECFGIKGREYLMHDYFIGRDREELSISEFISQIGDVSVPLLHKPIHLTSLHLTTNNDSCSTIQVSGVMDLQAVVSQPTPLQKFLLARGIRIDVSKGEF